VDLACAIDDLLGVEPSASDAELKKAYRTKGKRDTPMLLLCSLSLLEPQLTDAIGLYSDAAPSGQEPRFVYAFT
jgi:hypothetical protein